MFEYDEDKSQVNKDKHGIDFKAVQALWDDENIIKIDVPLVDELRFLNIGQIDGKFWTVVTTNRGDNIRIISARRSRKKEIALYEG